MLITLDGYTTFERSLKRGPPQAKPPPASDSRFNSLARKPEPELPTSTQPPLPAHSNLSSTTTSNASSSSSSVMPASTDKELPPVKPRDREHETQEMRTSYVEEPPSPETLRREAKGAAAALVRRVTNEMAMAHFVQKVEVNEEDSQGARGAYRCSQWPERVLRKVLWYMGKALANHNSIFSITALILVGLSLVIPVLYWDKLSVALPFRSLVQTNEFDVASSGVGILRQIAPNFNTTNPSYAPLLRLNNYTYAVLFKNLDPKETILQDKTIATYSNVKAMMQGIGFGGKSWTDLCSAESCSADSSILDKIVKKSTQIALTYPETYVSLSREDTNLTRVFLASTIGGVELDVDGAIASAQALLIPFGLNRNLNDQDTQLWEQSFLHKVDALRKEEPSLEVCRWSHLEFVDTVLEALERYHYWAAVSGGLVLLISLAASFRSNAYQSKPLIGLATGVVLLGSAAAGMCVSVSGSPIINLLLLPVTFIIMGIGSCYCQSLHIAWNKFSAVALHPSEKIALVMAYEGTFICASSLLLITMFVISGILSATPYVQTAFLTMAAGIAALLILSLLFLTVFVFKSGRREAKGCKWYHFCRSGDTHFPSANLVDFENAQLEVLHDRLIDTKSSPCRQFAAWLFGPSLRYPLVFLCTVYLLLAAWGCVNINIDLREEHFLPSHSEARKFLENFRELFGRTEEYLEITIEQTLDYHEPSLRQSILDLLEQPVKEDYASRAVSWLADFGRFEKSSVYEINQDTFVPIVRLVFLTTDPYQRYASDVVYDHFQMQITRSRMYLELNKKGVEHRREVVDGLLSRARAMQLPITIKAPFLFSIQHDLQSLSTALFAFGVFLTVLLFVSLFIFGQPSLTFVVVATSLCVIIETVGYASHWGVPLNTVTLTMAICANALSCVVSMSFCYAYANSGRGLRPAQRIQYTFQSCLVPVTIAIALPVVTYLPLLRIDAPIVLHIWRILLLNGIASFAHILLFLPNAVSFLNDNALSTISSLMHGADDESSIYYIPTAGRIIPTEGIYQSYNYTMPKMAPPPSYLAIGPADPLYGRFEPGIYGRMRRPSVAESSIVGTPRIDDRRRRREFRDPECIYEAPPSPMHRTTREEIVPPRMQPQRKEGRGTDRLERRESQNGPHWRQLLQEGSPATSAQPSYFAYNNPAFYPR
ncbi:unnamed protein product, partial [Mesorhabditis spiculigera]